MTNDSLSIPCRNAFPFLAAPEHARLDIAMITVVAFAPVIQASLYPLREDTTPTYGQIMTRELSHG
jgi:hypothetical protein